MLSIFTKFLKKIEESKISLRLFLLIFLSVIALRLVIESFSGLEYYSSSFELIFLFLHTELWFASLFIWVAIIFRVFTKIPIGKIAKVQLFSLPVIWLPALFNSFVNGNLGGRLTYILASNVKEYINYFFKLTILETNPEIIAFILLAGIYVYLGGKNKAKAALSIIISYTIVFLHISLVSIPVIAQSLIKGYGNVKVFYYFLSLRKDILFGQNYHFLLDNSAGKISEVFNFFGLPLIFPVLILGLIIFFYLWNSKKFFSFFKNTRPERLFYRWLMFFIGIMMAYVIFGISPKLLFWNLLSFVIILLIIAFAWLKAIYENDITDLEIDRISNPNRPLVTGKLSIKDAKNLNLILLILALVGASIISWYVFIIVFSVLIIIYTYSSPPLRLKKFFLLNSLTIALGDLTMVFLGFFWILPEIKLSQFPIALAITVLIAIILGINFKDIKDVEGDKRFGVKTIPVIFGEKTGKQIIGWMASAIFILVPFVFRELILLIPAIIFGALGYFLINRKNYSEKPIFLIYFLYIFMVIGFYILKYGY